MTRSRELWRIYYDREKGNSKGSQIFSLLIRQLRNDNNDLQEFEGSVQGHREDTGQLGPIDVDVRNWLKLHQEELS